MPKAREHHEPSPSPQLHFQPPPRRLFDDLGDERQEPLRSVKLTPHKVRGQSKNAESPLVGISPTKSSSSGPKRRSGLTQKHSHEDLNDHRSTEDLTALESEQLWLEEEQDWLLDIEHEDAVQALVAPDIPGKSQAIPQADVERPNTSDATNLHQALLDELREQGPDAVAAFRTALAEGKQHLNSVKLCFVGHARAGKTSTLLSLAGKPFDPKEPSTHGVATCTYAKELLSTSPSRATSTADFDGPHDDSCTVPWKTLGDSSSVAELWQEDVAMKVAAAMKAQAESKECSPVAGGEVDASGAFAPMLRSPSTVSEGMQPEVLKMPVDLIARAISSESSDHRHLRPSTVVMQTWDFAGQEMYYNMAHVFLTALGIYVLCLDLSSWMPEAPVSELAESLDFWLAALLVHAPDAQLVIVGTHADKLLDSAQEVYARVDAHLARRLGQMPALHKQLKVNEMEQLLFFPIDNHRETDASIRSIERLRAVLNELALSAAGKMGQIPSLWAHFFKMLEESKSGPCVSLADCELLAERYSMGLEQELQTCLKLFHRLGQLLYFEGAPAVVLEPQWLLDAMAAVVACPRVLQNHWESSLALRAHGALSEELLSVLWKEPRFRGCEVTLKAFLDRFDLLVPAAGGPHAWLVPSLLPQRLPECQGAQRRKPEATLLLDFGGAMQRLLPTLLPRLLCQLRKREDLKLSVFEVYRDFLALSLGSLSLAVTLEIITADLPEAQSGGCHAAAPALFHCGGQCRRLTTGIVCVGVSASGGRSIQASALRSLLDTLHAAMAAWLPSVSFSACLPCPGCSEACAEGRRRFVHVLDLNEVLNEELYCCRSYRLLEEQHLPRFVSEWKEMELAARQPAAVASNEAAIEVRRQSARPQGLHFFYASPLAVNNRRLEQLNIAKELRGLQGLQIGEWTVRLATADSVSAALVAQPAPAVLHISSHAMLIPPANLKRRVLLFEDEASHCSLGRVALGDADLAKLGPWSEVGILVLLSCGSESIARGLMSCGGLRCAVCTSDQVLDSAACCYCRAFYLALGAGHGARASHSLALASLRGCANVGLRKEADKFLLLAASDFFLPASGVAAHTKWPLLPLPRVEDYMCQVADHMSLARNFLNRRVALLCGKRGSGKTATCWEFCHHFSAPGGRLFSAGAFFLDGRSLRRAAEASVGRLPSAPCDVMREVLAQALLQELCEETVASAAPCADWEQMKRAVRRQDEKGCWLLVVDPVSDPSSSQSEEDMCSQEWEEALAQALEGLLACTAQLRLLLTSRHQLGDRWASLGPSKLVMLKPSLLPADDAARLFLARCRRPLYAYDFTATEVGSTDSKLAKPILPGGQLLDRLTDSELLKKLGGLPGRVVEAAAKVDEALPTLLQHPFLEN